MKSPNDPFIKTKLDLDVRKKGRRPLWHEKFSCKKLLSMEKVGIKVGGTKGGRVQSYMDSKFPYLNPNQITSNLAQIKYIKSNLIRFINF